MKKMMDRDIAQLCSQYGKGGGGAAGAGRGHRFLSTWFSLAQIKTMTDRDIARLWSQYVKELAVLLVRAEGTDPPQEVIARMEELVCRELLLLYIRCAICIALMESVQR